MRTQAYWALVVVCLLAAGVRAQQAPELVAEPDHVIRDTRGDGAQAFKITSTILGETRRIYVVVPVSYARSAPDRRYPVTVVLDGEANVPIAADVSRELSRNGQIPESIIVAIPNVSMRGRLRDLTPPGISVSGSTRNEGGDRFLDFIEKELLPAVDRQFRGGAPRTFIGHSSGGILVTYAAATRDIWRAVVAIDTPTQLEDGWLIRKLLERAKASPPSLRYISMEARFGWTEEAWEKLAAAAPATWKLYRESFKPRESHESMVMLSIYLGLREAFSDYSMLAAPVSPTTSILPYYARVGAALGAPVHPPHKLIRIVVEDLLMEGRGAAARDAYNKLVSSYGPPSDSVILLAQITEVERRPPPAETVEGLLATPFPTPEEARAFLGDWVGGEWRNADDPRPDWLTLHIKLADGRVVAEVEDAKAPPHLRLRRVEHLRITPTGLTFGYMNGMRPRGVILYEGRLEGDTLNGQMRMGGVDFRFPDGTKPKMPYFTFRRAR